MFIKRLTISTCYGVIRDIEFKEGLNLIIDETPIDNTKATGNNVGKTTVLKLIDFCLGAKPNIIYTDTENKKQTYELVKDFLIKENVQITLILTENLNKDNAREVEIIRNFLPGKQAVRKINGKDILEKDFEHELEQAIMPSKFVEKPTFRQVISHNIRYTDDAVNNTLKTLNKYTRDIEYETLYLYLLGCPADHGAKKQVLASQLKQENIIKEKLEKKQPKQSYEIMLSLLDDEISDLNEKRRTFNLNEELEDDLEQLDLVKYKINKTSSSITKLKIRKNLIEDSIRELDKSVCNIDLQQLRILYNEVNANIGGIQKTFEDLVSYHNSMVNEKMRYISQELPEINSKLSQGHIDLQLLLMKEKELTDKIEKSGSLEELEKIIAQLNEKYRKKGELENTIAQLNEVEMNIKELEKELEKIDYDLFSDGFKHRIKTQVEKFSKVFSTISQELYGEQYAITYQEVKEKRQQFYRFSSFNTNMS